MVTINTPDLWRAHFPTPKPTDHKYDRGHTILIGSDRFTGATRLAAEACSRIGSGLVTVYNSERADLFRACLPPDLMIEPEDLSNCRKANTLLAGPGGIQDEHVLQVEALPSGMSYVLDADAIRMIDALPPHTSVVTPHEGEFERFFGAIEPDRAAAARRAAETHQCVVLLKGSRSLISSSDGVVVENQTASPYLAKAGTGDVLAGLIAGLVAQGMPRFEATCAGVWIHGRASERIGPGLVAQDLFREISPVLREILA